MRNKILQCGGTKIEGLMALIPDMMFEGNHPYGEAWWEQHQAVGVVQLLGDWVKLRGTRKAMTLATQHHKAGVSGGQIHHAL